MEVNKIYQGDALGVLKTLPDKFVNCCVTSPPYYGLRSYQTNPVIWDNDENCQHEWGNKILPRNSKSGKHSEKSCIGAKKAQDDARRTLGTDFCSKCGAWRGELGAEPTPELYVKHLVEIFREVKRVLKDDGTVWLNLGDSYFGSGGASGQSPDHTNFGKKRTERSYASEGITRNLKHNFLKPKDLVGIPWMVAFALRADGWWLRQDIIWHKLNPMPESVTDRCTKSHEYIFLLSKSQKYYYDYEAILEEATGYDGRKDTMFKGGVKYDGFNQQTMLSRGHERWRYKNLKNKGQQNHSMHEKRANGESDENYPVRNKRSVWTVNPQPFKESHFAVFPEALIEPMILAGSPENGVILDPFMGAGTTGLVARKLNRNYIGFELNPEYIKIAENRILPIEEIKEIGYAKTKISKDHPTLF